MNLFYKEYKSKKKFLFFLQGIQSLKKSVGGGGGGGRGEGGEERGGARVNELFLHRI